VTALVGGAILRTRSLGPARLARSYRSVALAPHHLVRGEPCPLPSLYVPQGSAPSAPFPLLPLETRGSKRGLWKDPAPQKERGSA
jgi:hypothetical protein